jgi:hypothetical protein
VKLDLSKAYNRISFLLIGLICIHVGFSLMVGKWIEGCLNFSYFSLLVNGLTSSFFSSYRGLGQRCPLSLLLFIIDH